MPFRRDPARQLRRKEDRFAECLERFSAHSQGSATTLIEAATRRDCAALAGMATELAGLTAGSERSEFYRLIAQIMSQIASGQLGDMEPSKAFARYMQQLAAAQSDNPKAEAIAAGAEEILLDIDTMKRRHADEDD